MPQDVRLSLALHALKAEAQHAHKMSFESSDVDLTSLQRSWDQLIREVQRLDREGK